MAKRKPATTPTEGARVYKWLHIEPELIVYVTPYEVDGAPLPYTAAMLKRREARLSDEKFNAIGRTV